MYYCMCVCFVCACVCVLCVRVRMHVYMHVCACFPSVCVHFFFNDLIISYSKTFFLRGGEGGSLVPSLILPVLWHVSHSTQTHKNSSSRAVSFRQRIKTCFARTAADNKRCSWHKNNDNVGLNENGMNNIFNHWPVNSTNKRAYRCFGAQHSTVEKRLNLLLLDLFASLYQAMLFLSRTGVLQTRKYPPSLPPYA